MERSISSLTFKGSVPEAVTEAKNQKKLFVVYISGDDGDSTHSEQSTWVDSNVVDSVSKYCIFLHLLQGSVNALQFSAIYPQKSVPCITAIGYNGVQLWQHEGYISPENLVASIEKAWLSLHIQETTATFLTAALASNNSGSSSSCPPNAVLSKERNSLSSDQAPSLETVPLLSSELIGETETGEPRIKNVEASSPLVPDNELESGQDVKSASSSHIASTPLQPVAISQNITKAETGSMLQPVAISQNNTEVETGSMNVDVGCTGPRENIGLNDQGVEISPECLQMMAKGLEDGVQDKKAGALDSSVGCTGPQENIALNIQNSSPESLQTMAKGLEDGVQNKKAGASDSSADELHDILLNIRLLDGTSLKEKFPVTDTLRLVRDYVDKNQASGTGLYDLAIPYPRKIFGEQDLSISLSELGLSNRQALIVVPRNQAAGYISGSGQSSSRDAIHTTGHVAQSDDMNVGYWGHAKKLLSYINPFTYLGSGASLSSSEQGSTQNFWQYRPNSSSENEPQAPGRPYSPYTRNTSSPSDENAGKRKKPTSTRFGSNIHTLRHEEDDGPSKDRNTYWNGNSTQYGGNDNDK